MNDFRKLTDAFTVSPQISVADVADARALGVKLIINNRPEGESPDQISGDAIEAAAAAAGINYVAIPVTHSGFSHAQIDAMASALAEASGPVLAYCRSGTRSTLLWALAQALQGSHPDELASVAARAGYDLAPIRPMMDILRTKD